MIEQARGKLVEQQRFNAAYEGIFTTAISILREHGKLEREYSETLFRKIPTVRYVMDSKGIPIGVCVRASKKDLDEADKVWIEIDGVRGLAVKKQKRGDNIVYRGGYIGILTSLWSPNEAEAYLKSVRDIESALQG